MLSKSLFVKSKTFLNYQLQSNSFQFRAFAATNYDVAVIGGGPGGYVAAIKAA